MASKAKPEGTPIAQNSPSHATRLQAPTPNAPPAGQTDDSLSTSEMLPPSKPQFLEPRTEFLLDWTIKVLGVASAILFGIWAPISYKATSDGNADNNESQDNLVSKLNDMSAQATSAADLQSSAASGISVLQARMSKLATLSVWEFCEGKATSIPACDELSSSITIGDIITSLAGLGPLTTSAPSRSSTASAGTTMVAPESNSSSGSSNVSLAAVLGIVFGVLSFLGLISGFLIWRRKTIRQQKGLKNWRNG